MFYNFIHLTNPQFRTSEEVQKALIEACRQHPDIARYMHVGCSESGRDIDAVILGNGSQTVSLLAGAHSDEPVGPETLRHLILGALEQPEKLSEYFQKYRFVIIPHVNPDGEAVNQSWIRQWPDISAYIKHVFREPPGRDVEFGYPSMRLENQQVAAVLRQYAPFVMHMSLHSMGVAEGAFLLIEDHWIERTQSLRKQFVNFATKIGLTLHDHERQGEKGFVRIEAGFNTTPKSKAMQEYFHHLADDKTAALFHLNSMEFIRELGGDPLCLVTELPLFVIEQLEEPRIPGVPSAYNALQSKLPEIKVKLVNGEAIDNIIDPFAIRALELSQAIQFQLYIIDLGLKSLPI